jgi:hypothetical protein
METRVRCKKFQEKSFDLFSPENRDLEIPIRENMVSEKYTTIPLRP